MCAPADVPMGRVRGQRNSLHDMVLGHSQNQRQTWVRHVKYRQVVGIYL